jgi:hypothetical protein
VSGEDDEEGMVMAVAVAMVREGAERKREREMVRK